MHWLSRWFSDDEGLPHADRIVFAVGVVFAAIGWPLAIWVDPGAITMAAAATIVVLMGGVAVIVVALYNYGRRS